MHAGAPCRTNAIPSETEGADIKANRNTILVVDKRKRTENNIKQPGGTRFPGQWIMR